MCCVSFLLGEDLREPELGPAGGTQGLLRSARRRYGGTAQSLSGHSAQHVLPAEFLQLSGSVCSSCRVTLQSAGHGCAGGILTASPFLPVI